MFRFLPIFIFRTIRFKTKFLFSFLIIIFRTIKVIFFKRLVYFSALSELGPALFNKEIPKIRKSLNLRFKNVLIKKICLNSYGLNAIIHH